MGNSNLSERESVAKTELENLLDEHEAAGRLGLSVATMRRRRLLRLPPAWVKLGGRVLYKPATLSAFVDANVVPLPPAAGKVGPTGGGHQAEAQ